MSFFLNSWVNNQYRIFQYLDSCNVLTGGDLITKEVILSTDSDGKNFLFYIFGGKFELEISIKLCNIICSKLSDEELRELFMTRDNMNHFFLYDINFYRGRTTDSYDTKLANFLFNGPYKDVIIDMIITEESNEFLDDCDYRTSDILLENETICQHILDSDAYLLFTNGYRINLYMFFRFVALYDYQLPEDLSEIRGFLSWLFRRVTEKGYDPRYISEMFLKIFDGMSHDKVRIIMFNDSPCHEMSFLKDVDFSHKIFVDTLFDGPYSDIILDLMSHDSREIISEKVPLKDEEIENLLDSPTINELLLSGSDIIGDISLKIEFIMSKTDIKSIEYDDNTDNLVVTISNDIEYTFTNEDINWLLSYNFNLFMDFLDNEAVDENIYNKLMLGYFCKCYMNRYGRSRLYYILNKHFTLEVLERLLGHRHMTQDLFDHPNDYILNGVQHHYDDDIIFGNSFNIFDISLRHKDCFEYVIKSRFMKSSLLCRRIGKFKLDKHFLIPIINNGLVDREFLLCDMEDGRYSLFNILMFDEEYYRDYFILQLDRNLICKISKGNHFQRKYMLEKLDKLEKSQYVIYRYMIERYYGPEGIFINKINDRITAILEEEKIN